jgi:hypothetical protein
MFQILYDPSSGSTELYLTEITRSDSQIFCRVPGRCLTAKFGTCGVCVRIRSGRLDRRCQWYGGILCRHTIDNVCVTSISTLNQACNFG